MKAYSIYNIPMSDEFILKFNSLIEDSIAKYSLRMRPLQSFSEEELRRARKRIRESFVTYVQNSYDLQEWGLHYESIPVRVYSEDSREGLFAAFEPSSEANRFYFRDREWLDYEPSEGSEYEAVVDKADFFSYQYDKLLSAVDTAIFYSVESIVKFGVN